MDVVFRLSGYFDRVVAHQNCISIHPLGDWPPVVKEKEWRSTMPDQPYWARQVVEAWFTLYRELAFFLHGCLSRLVTFTPRLTRNKVPFS
jgi:hypothetical protein